MKRKIFTGLLTGIFLLGSLLLSSNVYAILWDRGGGLIYDDYNDVTWLQDANYSLTSGYDADGLMNWFEAMAWADSLEYYDSVRNTIWDDWRLPTTNPATTGSGSDDYDNQILSEMGHLFHVELGNTCFYSMGDCSSNNYGPFINLDDSYWHWSSTELPLDSDLAFAFCFGCGYQDYHSKDSYQFYVLPVMDGDVAAPVPEPSTIFLMGLGLLGLVGIKKTWKKS